MRISAPAPATSFSIYVTSSCPNDLSWPNTSCPYLPIQTPSGPQINDAGAGTLSYGARYELNGQRDKIAVTVVAISVDGRVLPPSTKTITLRRR